MEPSQGFSATFLVDQSPEAVFAAINDVRGWWSQEIEGNTVQPGDEFDYHFQDVHRCKMKIAESLPGKKVVWDVLDNEFSFTKDKTEWKGTRISFDIARRGAQTEVVFTHAGLVPEYECYEVCANAWDSYLKGSLRNLITSGQGQPNVGSPITEGERAWSDQDFTTGITVDKSPEEVFAAINNVRGWWSGEILGGTEHIGDEFSYRYEDLHLSHQRVVESIPGKRVVWRVTDASLSFTRDKAEWKGTEIRFDIARKGHRTEVQFTHVGLVPRLECFEDCSAGWRFYINGGLHNFISGKTAAAADAR